MSPDGLKYYLWSKKTEPLRELTPRAGLRRHVTKMQTMGLCVRDVPKQVWVMRCKVWGCQRSSFSRFGVVLMG